MFVYCTIPCLFAIILIREEMYLFLRDAIIGPKDTEELNDAVNVSLSVSLFVYLFVCNCLSLWLDLNVCPKI